jgi:MoaA/NifB/PqqE/SkfB family radical SAM enzyme
MRHAFKSTIDCISPNLKVRLGKPLKPKWIWFETTDKCNSRCVTCSIWKQKSTPKEKLIDIKEDFGKVLSSPLMQGICYVLNSGGEPTLVDLKELLHVEHQHLPKATLQISSNALLPEKLIDAVYYAMEIGVPTLDVGLSIDGVGEPHDEVRGVKGNFNLLEKLIALLKEAQSKYPNRICVTIGSTLTNQTAKQAKALYEYAQKVDIPFMWHWYNVSQSFYHNEAKLSSEIKAIVDEFPSNTLYQQWWRESLATGKLPKFRCFALNSFLVIKCNGDVVPCLSKFDQSIGNIKTQSIEEIWHSDKAKEIRRKVVDNCEGCLNSWGVNWSLNTSYIPGLVYEVKRRVRGKGK